MAVTYAEKLLDPRWQKRRLEILQRDHFTCQICGDKTKTLHVHHKRYFRDQDPWDYAADYLVTLCEDCHDARTADDREIQNDLAEVAMRILPDVSAQLREFVDLNGETRLREAMDLWNVIYVSFQRIGLFEEFQALLYRAATIWKAERTMKQ